MKFWKTTVGGPRRGLGTLAVAVALLGSLGTTTASAATGPGATSAVPASSSSFEHSGSHNTLGARSVSSAANACSIIRFGYSGEDECGTAVLDVPAGSVANNGSAESFVIGTDWSIWHAWPGSNGWHSLGGQSIHALYVGIHPNGVFLWSSSPFAIWTYGTDSNEWCINWGTPAWQGWHAC
jgi:hypothetical protein